MQARAKPIPSSPAKRQRERSLSPSEVHLAPCAHTLTAAAARAGLFEAVGEPSTPGEAADRAESRRPARASSVWTMALLLLVAAGATGQVSPGPPSLETVLDQLEANYLEYLQSVPNLFCDERVKSTYGPIASFIKRQEAVTDSTFRLQRVVAAGHQVNLRESREIKTVDGKPVLADTITGPSILSGVFGTASGLVSRPEMACMKFKMRPRVSGARPEGHRIVIDFAPLPRRSRNLSCGTVESEGRAFIDPETLRLRRIEVKTSGYEILPNVMGEWDWSAEYEPVVFDGKAFWLPQTIDSTAVAYGRSAMAWTFTAHYTGYHQLAVKSRIVPGVAIQPVVGTEEKTPLPSAAEAVTPP